MEGGGEALTMERDICLEQGRQEEGDMEQCGTEGEAFLTMEREVCSEQEKEEEDDDIGQYGRGKGDFTVG